MPIEGLNTRQVEILTMLASEFKNESRAKRNHINFRSWVALICNLTEVYKRQGSALSAYLERI